MRYVNMNDNKYFDIDMEEAQVQIVKDVHSEKELPSVNLLNRILSNKIEMKSHVQTLKTKNLFIEFQVDSYGNGIKKPSGISVTQSDMYFLNIGEMGLFLPVSFLKFLMSNYEKLGLEIKDNQKTGKDNIADGLIIPMDMLMNLYLEYEKYRNEEALTRVRRKLYPNKT